MNGFYENLDETLRMSIQVRDMKASIDARGRLAMIDPGKLVLHILRIVFALNVRESSSEYEYQEKLIVMVRDELLS